ncbi:hypothetical protein ACHAXH_000169 [Discostella pseudostelligera]
MIPFSRTSYEPGPYPQQIPSLDLSVMVNSYSPAGRHSIVCKCMVTYCTYLGMLLMTVPLHLLGVGAEVGGRVQLTSSTVARLIPDVGSTTAEFTMASRT